MIEFVHAKLKSMYIPGFLCKYFTKDMPQLKRWRLDAEVVPEDHASQRELR